MLRSDLGQERLLLGTMHKYGAFYRFVLNFGAICRYGARMADFPCLVFAVLPVNGGCFSDRFSLVSY